MSRVANEIYKDIKNNPEKWTPVMGLFTYNGLQKEDIKIVSCEYPRVVSLLEIKIKDKRICCSYMDRWRLQGLVAWWYRNCSVKDVLKTRA